MKKSKLLTLSSMMILSLLLGGAYTSCASDVSSVSSASEPSSNDSASSELPSSSEVINGHYDMWTKDQQDLMKKYCGEILPYPVGLVSGEIEFDEVVLDDYSFLQISDSSSSFTLKDYYKLVEKFDWNTIKSYNGDAAQDNAGTEYYELTKKASTRTKGYDLMYFFAEEEVDEDGTVVSTSGNVLRCYNFLCSFESVDSEYTSDELASMQETLTITNLPYLKMGGVKEAGMSDANTFIAYDYYFEDLSKENADILIKNGFTLDEELSKEYGTYILHKTLDDGATIDVQIYFFQGNNAYFYYTPKYYTSTSWPSALTDEIKTSTGIDVPQFEVAEGGEFEGYKKNGVYYIYTFDLKDGYDYDYYNEVELQNLALTWKESVELTGLTYVDDDYNPIGFAVVISLQTPTSTFVPSWPSTLISNTLSETFKIEGVTLPSVSDDMLPHKEMDFKYVIHGEDYYQEAYESYLEDITTWPEDYNLPEDATEEEIQAKARELALQEMSFTVSVFDQERAFYDAYADALRKLGWYESYTSEDDLYFEDPTGAVCVTLVSSMDPNWDDIGTTKVVITIGSGEEHSPEFYFEDESYSVGIGYDKELGLVKSMLPYDVTYSSSDTTGKITVDENGKVSVASDAEEGMTATITATINVPGEEEARTVTCEIETVKLVGYKSSTTKDDIKSMIDIAGYACTESEITNEWDEIQYNFDVNFGEATIEEVEGFVTESLIPEGYLVLQEENEDGELVDSTWYDDEYYIDEETSVECQSIVYSVENPFELYLDYDFSYGVIIRYHVYAQDGNTHLVVEVLNY